MFEVEFMSHVSELFYKRQKNLKRVLLEQLNEFLVDLNIKCENDRSCKLGQRHVNDVDFDKLVEAFELPEENHTMTELIVSFRYSVLGHLDNDQTKIKDSDLLDKFGLYKENFDKRGDFVSHIEFEERTNFQIDTPAEDKTREIKIFYVGLLAKENTTYEELTFERVELKGTKVSTISSTLNAQLFDPVQKYFEKHRHEIQALQKKLYTDKFSRSYYEG